jgi:hypothetical protein
MKKYLWQFCLVPLLIITGCSELGAVISEVKGPDEVPARFVPPKEPMLVLVEPYHSSGDVEIDAEHLGVALRKDIEDHKTAPLVDFAKLEKLKDANPDAYDKMTVDGIGRAVGAKQVLYVDVITSGIENPSGGGSIRGTMTALVRIVDTASGETRWPLDARNGEQVNITTSWERTDSSEVQARVRGEMADSMAEGIGKLFHPWTPTHEAQHNDVPGPG